MMPNLPETNRIADNAAGNPASPERQLGMESVAEHKTEVPEAVS